MEEIHHDADYDILTVQDINALLSETLDKTIINGEESIVSSDDDFEPALETEEINILELSSDPISAALYPLRKDKPIELFERSNLNHRILATWMEDPWQQPPMNRDYSLTLYR